MWGQAGLIIDRLDWFFYPTAHSHFTLLLGLSTLVSMLQSMPVDVGMCVQLL
jgi:hypothetical protein